MTRLELKRPLVSFDLETTGLDVRNDRIVEISCVKLHPDGLREVKTRRLNPTVPISAEATAVHGIHDADVADMPTFNQVAKSLLELLRGCDLTGFNMRHFDLPMLSREFARAGLEFPASDARIIDSRTIYMVKEPRDLAAAHRFYLGAELEAAHSAEADAVAAANILLEQIDRYSDLPADVHALHELCNPREPHWIDERGKLMWHEGRACLGFGKHRLRSLEELATEEPDYLQWILTKDFDDQVVALVTHALNGEFPAPPPEFAGKKPEEATAAVSARGPSPAAHRAL